MLQPKQALYNQLKADGKYTKSYEDFDQQFSTPEKQEVLYSALNKDGVYTKSKDEFVNQFFAGGVKKKAATDSPSQSPASDSTPITGSSGLLKQNYSATSSVPPVIVNKNTSKKKSTEPNTFVPGSVAYAHQQNKVEDPRYTQLYKNYVAAGEVAPEEVDAIRKSVDDDAVNEGIGVGLKRFFNKAADVITTIGSFGQATTAPDAVKFNEDPLSSEKAQAKKELQQQVLQAKKAKKPAPAITPDAITARAKEIAVDNRVKSKSESQVRDFLANAEDREVGIGALNQKQYIEQYLYGERASLNEKDKANLKKQELLKPAIDNTVTGLKALQKEAENYTKNGQQVPERIVQDYNDKYTDYQQLITDAQQAREDFVNNRNNLGSLSENIDIVKRDYDWGKNLVNSLAASTLELGAGAVGALDYAGQVMPTLSAYSETFRRVNKELRKAAEGEREQIAAKGSVDDIHSAEDLGRWMSTLVGEQVPIFSLIATGVGGVAAIGGTSTGQKYEDMRDEQDAGTEYNGAQMLGIPAAFGATETASAMVDLYLLKGTARAVSSATAPERQLIAEGLWQGLKENAVKAGVQLPKAALIEATDEAATQLAQNLIDIHAGDKKIGVWDNVKDAAAAGAAMGLMIPVAGGAASIVTQAAKPFTTDRQIQSVSASIQAMEQQLGNPELSETARGEIEKQLGKAETKQRNLLEKVAKRVGGMEDADFESIVRIENQQARLRTTAQEIDTDPTINEDTREMILGNIKKDFDATEQKRQNILSPSPVVHDINVVNTDDNRTDAAIIEETPVNNGETLTENLEKNRFTNIVGNEEYGFTISDGQGSLLLNENGNVATFNKRADAEVKINELNERTTTNVTAADGNIQPGNDTVGENGTTDGQDAATETTQPAIEPAADTEVAPIAPIDNNDPNIQEENIPENVDLNNETDIVSENPDTNIENETGFERKPGKKSVVSRIYEGDTSDTTKAVVEELGLDYEIENQESAQKIAREFVEKAGVTKALEAARTGIVRGAEKAFVYAEVLDKITEAIDNSDPTQREEMEAQYLTVLSEATNQFDQEARDSGRFISALNRIYNNSKVKYALSRQIERFKAANNGEIDEATLAKFKEADEKIKELEDRIRDAEQRAETAEQKNAMDNIVEDVERKKKQERSNKQKAKSIANNIRKLKITKPDAFNAATAGVIWDGAVEIVAKTVEAGGTLADAIKKGTDYIKRTKWYRELSKEGKENALNQFESSMNQDTEAEKVTVENGVLNIPNSVIRALVEGGIRDIDELSQAILDMVSEQAPDLTLRNVRDAITKYGRTVNPTSDEIQKEINLLKRLGRLISANEDVDAGQRPARTGLLREKPTQEERQMQRNLREKMRDLPMDNADLEKQWKTALDSIKSRLTNQIEDLNKQIAEGEKRKPERTPIAYDEEANALRQKRDELKTILDDMVGKPELTDEQKVQRATAQIERSIEKLKEQIATGNIGFSAQPKKLSTPELEALRKTRSDLAESLKALREEAGLIEQKTLQQAKDRVNKRITELQQKVRDKDFAKREKKNQVKDEELLKLEAEKVRWQEVYDRAVYENEIKNRTFKEKAREGIVGALNIFRILKATGELSPVLIQGGIQTVNLAVRKPLKLAKAFGKLFVAFGSNRRAELYDAQMKANPNYGLMKAAKLALVEPDYKLELREEQFVGNYINNIWNLLGKGLENASGKVLGVTETMPVGDKLLSIIKKDFEGQRTPISEQFKNINPLLALERGLTVYMNEMRMERFNDGVTMLEMEGKNISDNKKDFEKVATAINTLTGRANIGRLANISDILNTIFFSFRNTVSIFNQLNPYWYASLGNGTLKPSVAQKIAVYDMIRFATITTAAMYLLKAAAGDDEDGNPVIEIETDPRSSDFMKMRDGNVRFDAFHGMIPMITFFSRMITGETKSKGEIKELGSGMFTPTRADLLINLFANKLSPQAGIAYRYANTKVNKEGERVTKFGEPYDVAKELSLTPIYIESLREISKEDPDAYAQFLAFMGLFGVNSSVYDTPASKTKSNGKSPSKQDIEKAVKAAQAAVNKLK